MLFEQECRHLLYEFFEEHISIVCASCHQRDDGESLQASKR